jgi:hypothetical protein
MARGQRPLTRHARKKSQTEGSGNIAMGLALHFGAGRAVGGYGLPRKDEKFAELASCIQVIRVNDPMKLPDGP